nr:ABC transporter ATP-binding protein [Sulfitobacter algicola]
MHGPVLFRFAVLGVVSIMLGGVEILRLWELSRLVSDLLQDNTETPATWRLVYVLALFCIVHPALYAATVYTRNVLIQLKSYNEIRQDFFTRVLTQPYQTMRRLSTGKVLAYATSYPGSVVSLGSVLLSDLGYFIAFLVMLGIVLVNASNLLIIPVLFWIIALFVVAGISYRSIDRAASKSIAASSDLNGAKSDFLDNFALIKTSGNDSFHHNELDRRFSDAKAKAVAVGNRTTGLLSAVNFVNSTTIAMGVGILAFLQMRGEADVALFVLFVPVMLQLAAISQIAMGSINSGLIAIGEIRAVRKSFSDTDVTLADHNANQTGEITANAMTIIHPRGDNPILKDIDFTFTSGSRIGIAAPSGAGKSTLLLAIAGLVPRQSGALNVGKIEDRIAICMQEPQVLNTSISNNLLYGAASDATDRLTEILHVVELDEVLIPGGMAENGLETVISPNGSNLSGGQKQRLALARAILSRPEILILDEALSGVDEAQELRILGAIDTLLPNTTFIIASHRASSLFHCTRMFSIENARLVEIDKAPLAQ